MEDWHLGTMCSRDKGQWEVGTIWQFGQYAAIARNFKLMRWMGKENNNCKGQWKFIWKKLQMIIWYITNMADGTKNTIACSCSVRHQNSILPLAHFQWHLLEMICLILAFQHQKSTQQDLNLQEMVSGGPLWWLQKLILHQLPSMSDCHNRYKTRECCRKV